MLILVNMTDMVVKTSTESDDGEIEGITADMHAQQIFILILIYFIISLFVSATWLWGFITRCIFILPTITTLLVIQAFTNDEIRFGQELASAVLIFIFIETSTYINMK